MVDGIAECLIKIDNIARFNKNVNIKKYTEAVCDSYL